MNLKIADEKEFPIGVKAGSFLKGGGTQRIQHRVQVIPMVAGLTQAGDFVYPGEVGYGPFIDGPDIGSPQDDGPAPAALVDQDFT